MRRFNFQISCVLLASCLFLLPITSIAQQFELINYENGNSNNHVAVDKNTGRVWLCEFGPNNPLRYFEDGVFTVVPEVSGYITSMDLAPNGDLWVTSLSGTYQYSEGALAHYTIENSPILEGTFSVGFAEDLVYIGSNNGLYTFDGSEWKKLDGFSNVRSIAYDESSGSTYIGTLAYLYEIDTDGVVNFINWQNSNIPFSYIMELDYDKEGYLWLRSDESGFAKYDGNTFTHFTMDNCGILKDDISDISIDDDGNVWLGYSGSTYGISRFDGTTSLNYTPENSNYPDFKEGRSITNGSNNDIWISTYQGLIHLTFMSSSTNESTNFSFSISPNPTTDIVHITNTQNQHHQLLIHNSSGQLKLQQELEDRLTLDVSKYPTGLYFFTIQNEKGRITKTLVKE